GRGGEICQIMLREADRRWLRAPASGKCHENWAKLRLELLPHKFASVKKGARDRGWPMSQRPLIGNQDEIPRSLGLLGRIQQVGLARERNALKIFNGSD